MLSNPIEIPYKGIFKEIRDDAFSLRNIHGMPNVPATRIIPHEWIPEQWLS